MSPAVQRLRAEIGSDRDAILRCLAELESIPLAAMAADPGAVARAAVALHHCYCAIEMIMLRLAREMEGEPAPGPDWHQALLSTMALDIEGIRPRLWSPDSHAALRTLLSFRHFFRHAYSVALDPSQVERLREGAVASRAALIHDLDALDALLAQLGSGRADA